MRIRSGAVILALVFGAACANRADDPATPPAGGAQAGGAQAGGGAQAAGRAGGGGQAGGGAQAAGRAGGAGAGAAVTVQQHEAAMKSIAQTNGAMQKALKSNMLADAGKQAQELARLFGEVERFWQQNNVADAVKVAQTARTGATGVAGAAAANDQMKAMQAAASVGGTCKQCHSMYREGDGKATPYSIRAGVIKQ